MKIIKINEANKINICLVIVFLIFLISLLNRFVVFGSKAGLWVYNYLDDISIVKPIVLSIALFPIIWGSIFLTNKYAEKRTGLVLSIWFIFGLAVQALILFVRPDSLGAIVECPVANSFFTAVKVFDFRSLIDIYVNN